jgi:hypothetical protein
VLLLSVVTLFLKLQLLLFSTFQSSLIKLLIIRQGSSTLFFLAPILRSLFSKLEAVVLIQFVVSLFGIAFIYRIVSLVEKLEVVSRSKLNSFFCFLQLPLYFYLYFKELYVVILIYIGILALTLMEYDKIIHYFKEKTFEKLHLNLLDRLILLLKAGKSAPTSSKIVFAELNRFEKVTFLKFSHMFEINNEQNMQMNVIEQSYFEELSHILRSSSGVVEQLKSLREGLRLQKNLRHRSVQALQQTRAQALVCLFIYAVFVFLSLKYLDLELFSATTFISVLLFFAGEMLIFRLGGRIKWKT